MEQQHTDLKKLSRNGTRTQLGASHRNEVVVVVVVDEEVEVVVVEYTDDEGGGVNTVVVVSRLIREGGELYPMAQSGCLWGEGNGREREADGLELGGVD